MIRLEPIAKVDIPVLLSWIQSPEFLLQWAGPIFVFPLDREQLERHLLQTEGPQPRLLAFKVVDAHNGTMVGYIELSNIDRRNASATISRVLVGPADLRGRGIGAHMIREILRVGFRELGLHRIDLLVFDFNRAAIACYQRAGFKTEGLLRDARKMGDQYWSVYAMSILEDEWTGISGA